MKRVSVEVMNPSVCTPADISAFCELVRGGGEVDERGLEARVRKAKSLVFLYVERELVGIAALKQPNDPYRDSVFRNAGVPDLAASFKQELGWVFVPAAHRGKQYSRALCATALTQQDRLPTFATTRADNVPMQRTLEHLAFRKLGESWRSARRNRLVLYVATQR